MIELPAEILQHIFVIGHNDFDNRVTVLFQKTSFIQTIMRVSRYWRCLVLATPMLWTSIAFGFNQDVSYRSAAVNQTLAIGPVLRNYLSLSGERPLHMEFNRTFPYFNVGDDALQALAATAPRWESLALKEYYNLDSIMWSMPKGMSLTSLKSLSIEFVNSIHMSLRPTPVLKHLTVKSLELEPGMGYICALPSIEFHSAPSLTHLSLFHHNSLSSLFYNFPWAQITHFESIENTFYGGEVQKVFNSMNHLESLLFSGEMKTDTAVTIPTLRTLNLVNGDIRDQEPRGHRIEPLRHMTAPRLDTLRLDVEAVPLDIVEFLERSDCWIEELAIRRTSFAEDWGTPRLQEIKRLSISEPSFIEDDPKWLTRRHDDWHSVLEVLSELESIEIRGVPNTEKTVVPMLIDMLKSRLSDAQRPWSDTDVYLKSINVTFQRELHEDERKAWNDFIFSDAAAGISVVEGNV